MTEWIYKDPEIVYTPELRAADKWLKAKGMRLQLDPKELVQGCRVLSNKRKQPMGFAKTAPILLKLKENKDGSDTVSKEPDTGTP